MAIVTVDRLEYNLGARRLLKGVGFAIERGERVCLLGRNGEGKSTLLKILAGQQQAEDGIIQWQTGCQSALVAQEPRFDREGSVFSAVAEGLGHIADLITAYHEASRRVAATALAADLAELNRLQQQLEAADGWRLEQRVEQVISRLKLPADEVVSSLSGGWQRRVALGRALVREPALLLLDEPTNHLDIEAIEWLEELLLGYPGAVLFVTHDRSLLQKLATRIFELDRGQLTSWPGDYANYLRRGEERQQAEAKHNAEFDKKLAQEEAWVRQGIKARRTRNEGRVRALNALREERRARITQQAKASMELGGDPSGKLVIEARHIRKSFAGNDIPVVRDFSCRIMRGDRIGLLGPNGVGKTTLLRLLLGELEPDSGTVRLGSNVQIAYFDQHREQLREDQSVLDNLAHGSDTVRVNGHGVHVISYLQKFLFTPERARTKVSALSGGERNRLLLARLFTRTVNLLVLDEPTNDLDLETLEVLEDLLLEFDGTLLLVSHDRTFMDQVVTATLAFEDEAIRAYVGGYSDWLRQRKEPRRAKPQAIKTAPKPAKAEKSTDARPRKLSYREQRELEQLPARIEALEAELGTLQTQTSQAEFYQGGTDAIKTTFARLEQLRQDLDSAYVRWEALEQEH